MKIAIIGQGQLGSEFLSQLPSETTAGFSRPVVDITNPDTFGPIIAYRPNLIINCAAYTAVDQSESEPELAMRVNGDAPGKLARLAEQLDALFVHVSTDYVFDGKQHEMYTESHQTHPINVYGQSKLQGEVAVQSVGGRFIIARTAWLYGQQGPNFILTMLRLGKEKSEVRVVTDQHGSPTYTKDLADQIMGVVNSGREGLFHCVNSGRASKFSLVKELYKQVGLKTTIRPVRSSEFPTPATRPVSTILSPAKTAELTDVRPWQEGLADYLRYLRLK